MRRLTTPPIRAYPKKVSKLSVSQFLSKQPAIKKYRVKCIDGPYEGKYIKLSNEGGYLHTAFFSVPSYKGGELGRYVVTEEFVGCVIWETAEDVKSNN